MTQANYYKIWENFEKNLKKFTAWVIHLKDKKGISNAISNAFQNILDESNRKPNIIWVNKSSEFYNISMKSFLQNINIDIYSTHNEGKSVATERFIRTLKNGIYKYMTSVSKNVYIDKLDEPADVKSST